MIIGQLGTRSSWDVSTANRQTGAPPGPGLRRTHPDPAGGLARSPRHLQGADCMVAGTDLLAD